MITFTDEQQKNSEIAQQINAATCNDPASPYAGKYVAVAAQNVVAVADNLDDLQAQLDEPGAAARDAIWIEAGADHQQTYIIWSLCREEP